MRHERIFLQDGAARLDTYFLDASREIMGSDIRPVILIFPGGGYTHTTDREAEPVALAFNARGFHAAVLRYPVAPAVFPQALLSAAEAVSWLRRNAEENHIDPDQIVTCGFSAGGHLAGCLGVFWNAPFLQALTGSSPGLIRPNRQILCYPVITTGKFAHQGSFDALLGDQKTQLALMRLSLEEQVNDEVPPTFLWHTYTDASVPVENSLFFASALRRFQIPLEMHIYSVGCHGLSLATKLTRNAAGERMEEACAGWIDLACAWLERK